MSYIGAFAGSLLIAWLLTPLVGKLAVRIGAIDRESHAKVHRGNVPRMGGLVFLPVFLLAFLAKLIFMPPQPLFSRPLSVLVGALGIIGLGIYDDLKGANARHKFSVQIAVAALVWFLGVGFDIEQVGPPLLMQAISLGLTVFWIVLVTNAFNLIDGLDGLASGLAVQIFLVLALGAYLHRWEGLCFLLLALAGGVGGFWFHNRRGTIFLGDTGSLFLGYCAAIGSLYCAPQARIEHLPVGIAALSIPLLDTALSVWRRFRNGRPIFEGDLDHMHHRVIKRGFSKRRATSAILAFSAICNGLAALMILRDSWTVPIAMVLAVVWAGFSMWIGYFKTLATMLRIRHRITAFSPDSGPISLVRLNSSAIPYPLPMNARSSLESPCSQDP